MQRDYTIIIKVKGTTGRKLKSPRSTAIAIAESLQLKEPWQLAGVEVRSNVRRLPKPPVQRVVTVRDVRDTCEKIVLGRVHEIYQTLQTMTSERIPRATFRFSGSGGCRSSKGFGAHVHRGRGRPGLPRNLVCLNRPQMLQAYTDELLAELVCHELAHCVTKGRHRSKRFRQASLRLYNAWALAVGRPLHALNPLDDQTVDADPADVLTTTLGGSVTVTANDRSPFAVYDEPVDANL